ncbi:MAG: hypothetical protein LC802_16875 [Acidobacteria bacterium]|nr:hypothetical protein [Acidobacteriota bacterium]
MKSSLSAVAALAVSISCAASNAHAQSPTPPRSANSSQTQQAAPGYDEWGDEFGGGKLDESKWERFTFEGTGGGKLEVKDGQVRIRSGNGTRSGIRTRQSFAGDRYSVEARIAKVGPAIPEPGQKAAPLGFAGLTILFDSSGRNRIEWILTSEGTFEAWQVVDGRGERIDNRKLGTKIKNPLIGVVRRGDEFLFVLNGPDSPPGDAQVGLKKKIKNMPRSFHVMLYGFGSSENNWDAVRVVTMK